MAKIKHLFAERKKITLLFFVKKLEEHPCMTCLELDSIVENLAMLAWAKESEADAEATRLQELKEMTQSMTAFEQADESDNR